jgi:alcohol dehydrogenase class IV
VETLASGFANLAADLQIPTSLKDVGITEADLSLLSTEAMKVRFATCIQWRLASQRLTSAYSPQRP